MTRRIRLPESGSLGRIPLPQVDETFVLQGTLEMQKLGTSVETFSLMRHKGTGRTARNGARGRCGSPSLLPVGLWLDNAHYPVRQPGRHFSTLLRIARVMAVFANSRVPWPFTASPVFPSTSSWRRASSVTDSSP
jgi:hypothetical protein